MSAQRTSKEKVSVFELREVASERIGHGDKKYHLKLLARAADALEFYDDGHCNERVRVLESALRGLMPEGWGDGDMDHMPGIKAARLALAGSSGPPPAVGPLKLDTDRQVFFYEQDHYYLSNFSAFRLNWADHWFDTSEAAYHWEKFPDRQDIRNAICRAESAHEAFKMAEWHKAEVRSDWTRIKKVATMRSILRAKAEQHEYVRRKLLETGDRELIENSWRDDFWGWGPNRDGENALGKLWMEIRAELRSTLTRAKDERGISAVIPT